MCQLTLIYFKDINLLKDSIINAAVINPLKATMDMKTGHVDGFGFFINRDTLWKTSSPGYEIVFNLDKIKPEPIIQHVRKVSKGVISDENAHPFEFDYFVAAHNGTLLGGFIQQNDKTDSEQFFNYVNELIKKDNKLSVVEAFKKAYDDIEGGKFAFMVYDKRKNKYYIIRGNATLYYSYLYDKDDNVVGIIINTEEKSLFMNLFLLRAKYGVRFTEPKLLEENTIYYLNEEIIKIEKVENVVIKYKNVIKYKTSSYWNKWNSNNYNGYYPKNKNNKKKEVKASVFFRDEKSLLSLSRREIYEIALYMLFNIETDYQEIMKDVDSNKYKVTDPTLGYSTPIILGDEKEVKRKLSQFILEKEDEK